MDDLQALQPLIAATAGDGNPSEHQHAPVEEGPNRPSPSPAKMSAPSSRVSSRASTPSKGGRSIDLGVDPPRMTRKEKRRRIQRLIQREEVYERERPLPRDIVGSYTSKSIARYMGKGGMHKVRMVQFQRKVNRDVAIPSRPPPQPQIPPMTSGALMPPPRPSPRPPCTLYKLPPEVRNNIYRFLVVQDQRIRVRSGWTETFGRGRPAFPGRGILFLNRQIYNEAVTVLYRENIFEYFLRDATMVPEIPSAEGSTQGSGNEDDGTYEGDAPNGRSRRATKFKRGTIDIAKFGPLMSKVVLKIESNRTGPEYRESMANAIRVFCNLKPRRANIHTMTIEISPTWLDDEGAISYTDFFDEDSSVTKALKALPCQFIKIAIRTPRGLKFDVVINRRYSTSIRRERKGNADFLIEDVAMRHHRHVHAQQEWQKLTNIHETIREACEQDIESLKISPDGYEDEDDDYDDSDSIDTSV